MKLKGVYGTAAIFCLALASSPLWGQQTPLQPLPADTAFWNGLWSVTVAPAHPLIWSDSLLRGDELDIAGARGENGRIIAQAGWDHQPVCLGRHGAAIDYDPQQHTLLIIPDETGMPLMRFYSVSCIPGDPADGYDGSVIMMEDEAGRDYELTDRTGVIYGSGAQVLVSGLEDSLVSDTGARSAEVLIKDGDMADSLLVRLITFSYGMSEDGFYTPSESRDTVYLGRQPLEGDSVEVSLEIPGFPRGTGVRCEIGYFDGLGTGKSSCPFDWRIYPMRGKATASLAATNVTDLLRLVYLVAGVAGEPRGVDYLGLDMDGSGDFDAGDLELLMELWRGSPVVKSPPPD